MNYFKAAVLEELNKELVLHELEHVSPQRGQVKVKLISSGICGAQINEINGIKGPDRFLPHLLGHEGFGEVVETGQDVKNVKSGDFVILHWRKSKGIETLGGKYKSKKGIEIASGSVTTFSTYTIVSENRVSKVKNDNSLHEIYPLLGCALSTAYGIVTKESSPNEKSKILISGVGGLGLSICYWLKVLYPSIKIDLIDKNLEKLKHLKALANIEIFNSLNNFNSQNEYDFIYDTTGNVDLISSAFNHLAKDSNLILVGQPKLNSKLVLSNPLKFFSGIKIFSSDGGKINFDLDLDNMINKLDIDLIKKFKLISKVIKLDDINKAITDLQTGIERRIIIKFHDNI